MKKLFGISFLLALLCFAAPVYAEGDLPAGNRDCTQNCGLYEETTPPPSDNPDHDDTTILEIYAWICERFAGFID